MSSVIPTPQDLDTLNEKLKMNLTINLQNIGIKIPNIAMPEMRNLYTSIIDDSNTNEPDPNEIAALLKNILPGNLTKYLS